MPVGRAGLSPVMVGRAAELERLGRLRPVRDPEVAMVAGEGGVGKTRLVGELVAGLAPGTRVLSGRAMEGGIGRPFGLLQEALVRFSGQWTVNSGQVTGCFFLSTVHCPSFTDQLHQPRIIRLTEVMAV